MIKPGAIVKPLIALMHSLGGREFALLNLLAPLIQASDGDIYSLPFFPHLPFGNRSRQSTLSSLWEADCTHPEEIR